MENQDLVNIFTHFSKEISEQISNAISAAGKTLSGIFEGFAEACEKLPLLTKKVIVELHSSGWYAYWVWEWGMSEVFELHEKILNGDVASIDDFMCSYINDSMERIQQILFERFPDRFRILKFAFDAHVRGEYALSIPVFLAQAEGMSVDILGKRLFSTENGAPKTLSVVSGIELDEIDDFFLDPLKTVGPINACEKDKDKFLVNFNRHEVLHGVTTDYDSGVNSYKAIALLKYLSGFVYDVAKNKRVRISNQ